MGWIKGRMERLWRPCETLEVTEATGLNAQFETYNQIHEITMTLKRRSCNLSCHVDALME